MKLGGVAVYFRDCTTLPKGITNELMCHLDTSGAQGPERSATVAQITLRGGGNFSRVSKRPSLPKPSSSLMGEEGHPGSRGKRRMWGGSQERNREKIPENMHSQVG